MLYDNETYADDGISAAEMNTPKACVVVGRNLVGHINRSTQVTAKLKECQRIGPTTTNTCPQHQQYSSCCASGNC